MLISLSQESGTSPERATNRTFQHIFFLQGFMFTEYLKPLFCSSNKCLKKKPQGFFCHQPAPHFLFVELLQLQNVVTSRVPVIFSDWEQSKVQELFYRNSKHKLGSNCIILIPIIFVLSSAMRGLKQWKVLSVIIKSVWKFRYKISFHFF